MSRKLPASAVEYIHDVMVGAFLPFDEHIGQSEYRNKDLIGSAVARPFQTAFGQEIWPTTADKAAALFHALACNHCFLNGNKRTAVIALDIFLMINGWMLMMTSEEVYLLATSTVQANAKGQTLSSLMQELVCRIDEASIDLILLQQPEIKLRLQSRNPAILARTEKMFSATQVVLDAIESNFE